MPQQIIFGYLQVKKVMTDPFEIKQYHWHPHACESRLIDSMNALYMPNDSLSFDPLQPGYGVLDNRSDRVLTMPKKKPATWVQRSFYSPESICGNRKNSAEGGGLNYAGQWQELVLRESEEASNWARNIIGRFFLRSSHTG